MVKKISQRGIETISYKVKHVLNEKNSLGVSSGVS